jgi:hypothetical protein
VTGIDRPVSGRPVGVAFCTGTFSLFFLKTSAKTGRFIPLGPRGGLPVPPKGGLTGTLTVLTMFSLLDPTDPLAPNGTESLESFLIVIILRVELRG